MAKQGARRVGRRHTLGTAIDDDLVEAAIETYREILESTDKRLFAIRKAAADMVMAYRFGKPVPMLSRSDLYHGLKEVAPEALRDMSQEDVLDALRRRADAYELKLRQVADMSADDWRDFHDRMRGMGAMH